MYRYSSTGLTARLRSILVPVFGTQSRRRMSAVAATAVLVGVVTNGANFALPLWVTHELNYSPDQWARLQSLRWIGVTLGVIVLGAIADRFGHRGVGVLVLAALGGALLLPPVVGPGGGMWVLMPVLGALMSTTFVNLNTLTQEVSDVRQGLANTIYRSIGAATSIAAPLLVALLASRWHSYGPTFVIMGAGTFLAIATLRPYPDETRPEPFSGVRGELRALWRAYLGALRQRDLMHFIHVSLAWNALVTVVGAFAAIRFTKELGRSDEQFAGLASVGGVCALAVVIAGGVLLDRVRSLRNFYGAISVAAALCPVAMGLGDYPVLSAVAFVAFVSLHTMIVGPMSMWVSRAAGAGTQGAAFAVHKVITALYMMLAAIAFSFLEPRIGMRRLFLFAGLLAVLVSVPIFFLAEPRRPRSRVRRAARRDVFAVETGQRLGE